MEWCLVFIQGNYFSEVLNRKKNFSAVIPDGNDSETKIVFLLHGMQSDHLEWPTNTPLAEIANKHNVIFFCPEGENSFYTDHTNGEFYGEAIGNEFYHKMKQLFRYDFSREKVAIAGYSMGGYGAIRLALKYPHYSMIGGFSPAFVFYKKERKEKHFQLVFSAGDKGSENDCIHLFKKAIEQDQVVPLIRLACGVLDPLNQYTNEFYQDVLNIDENFDIEYTQQEGFHDFSIWRKDLMRFMNEFSPLKEKKRS